ncbi:MAG: aminotransferase class IV [Sphingomonadaceae bacterium]
MSREVLLNGKFVPYEEAMVRIDDRGFQFSEGVYEVIRVYHGKPFEMERHMARMRSSVEAVGLDVGSVLDGVEEQSLELLRRSGLQEAYIYIQVTSGAAPRVHLAPSGLTPTVIAIVGPASPPSAEVRSRGIRVMTVPDQRWAMCFAKTTMLLPNTTAKKRALAEGYDDAIFVRDGFAMEGTAANMFAVFDGVLTTPPATNYILHGVTRAVVLDLAKQIGMPHAEAPIPAAKLGTAEEVFLTGTVGELIPVVSVDGKTIGTGKPGPVYARMYDALQRRIAEL